jgi:iron-sulfur cluster repair protein YtfE (RIC family)
MAAKDDQSGALKGTTLGALIGENPRVLKLLDRYGIVFCPGCYLTLFSTPAKAAAHHAVEDKKAFLKDLAHLLSSRGPDAGRPPRRRRRG